MAGVFDDSETGGFDTDRPGGYSLEQYDNYYDQTFEERDELLSEHGDNLGTPSSVRVKYRELNRRLRVIEEERNKLEERGSNDTREKSKSRRGKDRRETPLFDDSSDYKGADLYVLRIDGKNSNLLDFINGYIDSEGKVDKSVKNHQKVIISRFLKSYLAVSDGDGVRPLLNSRYNHELQKDTTFGRNGNSKSSTLTTFLRYRGVDVRKININKGFTERLNINSVEEKQFSALVRRIFSYSGEVIKRVSKKTKMDPVAVQEVVDNDDTIAESIERGVGGESAEQISWGTGIELELVRKVMEEREDSVEQISEETKAPPEKVKEIIEKREDSIKQISEVAGVPLKKVEEIIEREESDNVKQISEETEVPPGKVEEIIEKGEDSIEQISRVTGVRPEQVKYVVRKDSDNVKQISGETEVPPEKVKEIVKKRPRFTEITDDVIKRIQEGRVKDLKLRKLRRPLAPEGPDLEGERLRLLREQLEKIPDDLKGRRYPRIVLPLSVENGIIDNSVSKIRSSLHEREKEIESLVLTDQELREFTGILDPKGDTDTKIAALNATANEYRLKALREAEPRKEQLYKNIQETARKRGGTKE